MSAPILLSFRSILTHSSFSFFFFFNDTATTEIYTLSLHDALPILPAPGGHPRSGEYRGAARAGGPPARARRRRRCGCPARSIATAAAAAAPRGRALLPTRPPLGASGPSDRGRGGGEALPSGDGSHRRVSGQPAAPRRPERPTGRLSRPDGQPEPGGSHPGRSGGGRGDPVQRCHSRERARERGGAPRQPGRFARARRGPRGGRLRP